MPHTEYLALDVDQSARAAAYRALFEDALGDDVVAEIRAHLQQQKALGSDRFQAWVEARTGKFAGLRRPGELFLKGMKDADVLSHAALAHAVARSFYLNPPPHAIRDSACAKLGIKIKKLSKPNLGGVRKLEWSG